MTVIVCPATDDRVEQPYQKLLFLAAIPSNQITDFLQKSVHVFLGRFNQELAVIFAEVLPGSRTPAQYASCRFSRGELQAPFGHELLDQWLDFIFQQLFREAGDDEVIRISYKLTFGLSAFH